MTRGLSSLKNIVYRLFYKLDFFCLSKLQTDAKLCSTERDIFQEGYFMNFDVAMVAFNIFKSRTKASEVLMCFLQKNCTRTNNFIYNIWQQINISKVNTYYLNSRFC